MNKPSTSPWIEESVTCQFTPEQLMALMGKEIAANKLGFFSHFTGLIIRVGLNSDEDFLTCYYEAFIGFAVELKEVCDHTEIVFRSRLETWQLMRRKVIRLNCCVFSLKVENIGPLFPYDVPHQGDAGRCALSHNDSSHRWRNWWEKRRIALYVIV